MRRALLVLSLFCSFAFADFNWEPNATSIFGMVGVRPDQKRKAILEEVEKIRKHLLLNGSLAGKMGQYFSDLEDTFRAPSSEQDYLELFEKCKALQLRWKELPRELNHWMDNSELDFLFVDPLKAVKETLLGPLLPNSEFYIKTQEAYSEENLRAAQALIKAMFENIASHKTFFEEQLAYYQEQLETVAALLKTIFASDEHLEIAKEFEMELARSGIQFKLGDAKLKISLFQEWDSAMMAQAQAIGSEVPLMNKEEKAALFESILYKHRKDPSLGRFSKIKLPQRGIVPRTSQAVTSKVRNYMFVLAGVGIVTAASSCATMMLSHRMMPRPLPRDILQSENPNARVIDTSISPKPSVVPPSSSEQSVDDILNEVIDEKISQKK